MWSIGFILNQALSLYHTHPIVSLGTTLLQGKESQGVLSCGVELCSSSNSSRTSRGSNNATTTNQLFLRIQQAFF